MENNNTYHLDPGYIYCNEDGHVIRTVLGSCVAVCLWDSFKKVGGMCCYFYPGGKRKSQRNGKYSEAAITQLMKMMKELKCSKESITAQLYGGGCKNGYSNREAQKRVDAGIKFLRKHKIEIISKDLGGSMGRKILFDTASGHVVVLKVHNTRQDDWF